MGIGQAGLRSLLLSAIGLVVGCGGQAGPSAAYRAEVARVLVPRPPLQVAAPATMAPKPWRLGQWSIYRTTRDGDIAYEWLGIVAQDHCGLWVRFIRQTVKHETSYTACVRPDDAGKAQVFSLISEIDGARSTVDLQRTPAPAWPLDAFVPAWTSADGASGEAIDTAAGHFEGAMHAGPDIVHASVPFSGRVKGQAPDGARIELVAFGDDDAPGIIAELGRSASRARAPVWRMPVYVAFGAGMAKPLGHGHEEMESALGLRARLGAHLGRRLGLYAELLETSAQRYRPDPTQLQSLSQYALGARGLLLDGRFGELYARGGMGVGFVERETVMNETTTDIGFAASLGLGLSVPVSGATALTLELADDVIFAGGARHNLGVHIALELPVPLLGRR